MDIPLQLQACVVKLFSKPGWRLYMEDAHLSIPNFKNGIGLFAVFDGHGGKINYILGA